MFYQDEESQTFVSVERYDFLCCAQNESLRQKLGEIIIFIYIILKKGE